MIRLDETDRDLVKRAVPEWRGSSPDAAIPTRVKARVWLRCGGRCALTGKKLSAGDDVDFDHITPLSMGGEHRELNLQLVSRAAHREKTAAEAPGRAKAARIHAKHNGYWPASKAKIQSRGFDKSRNQRISHD
jgi:5-methylcytosine-specific restriction endonuclease McrA